MLRSAVSVLVRPADPPRRPDEALLFLGADADGSLIEVVAVELDGGRLRIIHAMPMRTAYRRLHESTNVGTEDYGEDDDG